MNLVVAFCTVVSAGGSTISSIRLGQKDTDGATESAEPHPDAVPCQRIPVRRHLLYLPGRNPALFRCQQRNAAVCTELYADNPVGYAGDIYNDRVEQHHACHGVSQESDADFDGYGGVQHYSRPCLHLPLRLGYPRRGNGNGHFAIYRHDMGGEPLPAKDKHRTLATGFLEDEKSVLSAAFSP